MKNFAHLSISTQENIKKQIVLLADDPQHPTLNMKHIQRAPGIYAERIGIDYLLTYERDEEDTLVLRVVDRHDKALKNP